ncbi:heat-inducible transcriptional repressor HrcA [Sulfurivirga sp.]|uniref:heat-inducible transcriptional repressor HrcA n=1 Tax=Sulfurivirga sp. TaxID=2614236 RepID=UPI0025F159DF|nr:heat-inducible transcriptional repressor HrcA [Sulfurivirga sp.]
MLGERDQLLLRKLIELYLKEGRPVGSRTLSKLPEINVSAATIRNVMADLEERGLIASPHTSAGRVPTARGLRFYVDRFLTITPLERAQVERLSEALSEAGEADAAIDQASRLLSELSGMVSIVRLPDRAEERVSRVALVPLSERRVLVVLVFNNQEAENRFIELARPLSAEQLEKLSRFFNEELEGLTLREARARLVTRMQQLHADLNEGMRRFIEAAEGALARHEQEGETLRVTGKTRLLQYEELADVERLRELFATFEQQRDLLHVLDRSLEADGVQVFIGRESGVELDDDCALVARPWSMDDTLVGALGVIGPARMPYDRVIPLVDMTGRILESVLKKHTPAPLNE